MYGDLNLPFPEFLRNRPGSPAGEAGFNQGGFGSGGGGGLVRHSSSPAGFFANLNVENGFGRIRNLAGFQSSGSVASTVDSSSMPSGRLKGQISFSSGQGSTGLMSQISELGDDIDGNCPEEVDVGGVGIPGFQATSWEDSGLLSDSFPSRKRVRDHLETHNGEARNHARSLTHQFSLPNEKFLHFEESTPWKIRAKRGFATHPRSIAERVRRTRISERIRKLQELVPNMDKQTSTSDMLELAVDYIKQLQRQTEELQTSRASCTCSSNHIKPI